jgi:hypothetical protein
MKQGLREAAGGGEGIPFVITSDGGYNSARKD